MDSTDDAVSRFTDRILTEWLPAYCSDPQRGYSAEGFDRGSITVSERDAADFLLALECGVVKISARQTFRAHRSKVSEVIFWEGHKKSVPRKITLWLEPVIAIAAVGRLFANYGWPAETLGLQSPKWGFDLVAFLHGKEHILGEVKKTANELEALLSNLRRCCGGDHIGCENSKGPRLNAHRKWKELEATRPAIVWLIGPGGVEHILLPSFAGNGVTQLVEAEPDRLRYVAPQAGSGAG